VFQNEGQLTENRQAFMAAFNAKIDEDNGKIAEMDIDDV
jgi:hypothetical protein